MNFPERLFAMQDKQYAAFQAKLTPGVPMESFNSSISKERKEYLRTLKVKITQDTSTYYVWIGGSCDYDHKERYGSNG